MIHGIILNMLDPANTSPLSQLLSPSGELHPSEIEMMKKVLKCIEIHRDIKNFIMKYSSKSINKASSNDGKEDLSEGLYLEAFASSIDFALDPFRAKMLELEKKHVQNAHLPVSYFLTEIREYEIFFHLLKQLIDEMKTQKYHGCAILGLMHKYNFHADIRSTQAIKTIRCGIYSVFLQQLSHWLIYGRILDINGEFFIFQRDICNTDDGKITTTSTMISETVNTSVSLWQFQISYSKIPPIFTTTLAEKVLFIGQTVRMLIDNDPGQPVIRKSSVWSDDDNDDHGMVLVGSLWKNKEHMFFNKIQMLYNVCGIDTTSYEQVVNEIKLHVTERLSEIAFNQADLIKHLRLIKDYYLLGRGELFLEFINQLKNVKTSVGVNENLARDVNDAFQKALNRTSIDLDHLTVHFLLDENIDFTDFNFMQLIRLNFNVKWPLHLFFSPICLEKYNIVFSFLLEIRHMQNELHCVWSLHREKKVSRNSILSQLRNKMLFLIDNLQYYLQVDVLESQFSSLKSLVQNSKDFEAIQRAHTVFQTNIMSLSFLINAQTADMMNTTANTTNNQIVNPVFCILKKIFALIQSFCNFNQVDEDLKMESLYMFEEQFSKYIQDLLKLLSNRLAGPASEPLSQLLLRLDFNYWFSSCSPFSNVE